MKQSRLPQTRLEDLVDNKKPQQKPQIPKELVTLHAKVLKAQMQKQLERMDYEKATPQDGFGLSSHHAHHLGGDKMDVTTTAHHKEKK